MHEKERHRIIISAVQERPVATVFDLCNLTGVSEATIRRDIATLHVQQKLRRVRGGRVRACGSDLAGLERVGGLGGVEGAVMGGPQQLHELMAGAAAVVWCCGRCFPGCCMRETPCCTGLCLAPFHGMGHWMPSVHGVVEFSSLSPRIGGR